MAPKEMVRLGGRSARIEAAVHQAAKDLLDRLDRAEISIPAIAARAGVTPSTIYRRWGDVNEILADVALQRLLPLQAPADTGAARTDLEAWLDQFVDELSSPLGREMIRDLICDPIGPKGTCRCHDYTRSQLEVIAARARRRMDTAFSIDDVIDFVVAPVLYHMLFAERPLGRDAVSSLFDRIAGL